MTAPRWISNDYRHVGTAVILEEVEVWLWERADLLDGIGRGDAAEHAAAGVAFVDHRLAQANAELARRERLRRRPDAPAWPDRWPDRRAEVERVKAAIDLAAYVESMFRVRLEPRGAQLACRCPLPDHDDRTPSFYVHPEKQLWHCYGCGRGGDVVTLAAIALGSDRFGDVLAHLAEEAWLSDDARREARVG